MIQVCSLVRLLQMWTWESAVEYIKSVEDKYSTTKNKTADHMSQWISSVPTPRDLIEGKHRKNKTTTHPVRYQKHHACLLHLFFCFRLFLVDAISANDPHSENHSSAKEMTSLWHFTKNKTICTKCILKATFIIFCLYFTCKWASSPNPNGHVIIWLFVQSNILLFLES